MASTNRNFAVDFLVAGLSAGVSKLAGAPLNRSRLLLQAQGELVRQGRLATPFTGMWSALAHVARTEGPLGLVRGVAWDVLTYFPTQALNFALKDAFNSMFGGNRRGDSYAKWFLGTLIRGGLAGAISLLATYPLQLIQTVQSADIIASGLDASYSFPSAAAVLSKTVKHSGVSGLFSGFGVSVAGVMLYRAAYFGLYDMIRAMIPSAHRQNFVVSFLMGWSVSILAGLLSYPLDTIRRRMMIAAPTPLAYSDALDCTLTIWREEGIQGFFHGALSNIFRAVMASVALVLWDQLQLVLFAPNEAASNNASNANRV